MLPRAARVDARAQHRPQPGRDLGARAGLHRRERAVHAQVVGEQVDLVGEQNQIKSIQFNSIHKKNENERG